VVFKNIVTPGPSLLSPVGVDLDPAVGHRWVEPVGEPVHDPSRNSDGAVLLLLIDA
jgi:hypothetical protein